MSETLVSLDRAIETARIKSKSFGNECNGDWLQLVGWLEELRDLRAVVDETTSASNAVESMELEQGEQLYLEIRIPITVSIDLKKDQTDFDAEDHWQMMEQFRDSVIDLFAVSISLPNIDVRLRDWIEIEDRNVINVNGELL